MISKLGIEKPVGISPIVRTSRSITYTAIETPNRTTKVEGMVVVIRLKPNVIK
jgi:hypothetical protein